MTKMSLSLIFSLRQGGVCSQATIRDKIICHTCLKFHSFIISFCLNAVNPPIPESMLFTVKERLEGLKYNFGFRGRGGGTQGEGIGMFTVQKGVILKKSLNTFVPHCRFCLKILNPDQHAIRIGKILILTSVLILP